VSSRGHRGPQSGSLQTLEPEPAERLLEKLERRALVFRVSRTDAGTGLVPSPMQVARIAAPPPSTERCQREGPGPDQGPQEAVHRQASHAVPPQDLAARPRTMPESVLLGPYTGC